MGHEIVRGELGWGVLLRAGTVGIRFVVPILVMALAGQEEVGRLYIYSSAFALIIFAFTFELNIFFAKNYVDSPSMSSISEHFLGLLTSELLLYGVLGAPALVFFLWWLGEREIAVYLGVLFYLGSEVVVNEYGRFLTNINRVRQVVFRDLYRAASYGVAGFVSLMMFNKIVTWPYFCLFGFFNIALLTLEGMPAKQVSGEKTRRLRIKHQVGITLRAIRETKGAVAQSGFLYLYPLIERLTLERTVGLGVLGGYAFFSSGMQAAISVLFLPAIAKLRSAVIQLEALHLSTAKPPMIPGLQKFIFRIIGIGIIAIFGFEVVKWFNWFGGKFDLDIWFAIAALFGVAAVNVIYVVSPHYSRSARFLSSSLITSAISLCALLCAATCFEFVTTNTMLFAMFLVMGFVLQIVVRRHYLYDSPVRA